MTAAPGAWRFPPSFSQQRLWVLDRLLPPGSVYNLASGWRLDGALAVDSLRWAVNEVVRRHEALRTTIGTEGGEPVQLIAPELVLALEVEALDGLPPEARQAEALRRTQAEASAPFDLARGPLIRTRLLRLAEREHWLLVTVHHVVSDGWSLGVLWHELSALYQAHREGAPSPLPELPIQYADYAVWQRGWLDRGGLTDELDYWQGALADLPVLELPTDRPRPAVESHRGARAEVALDPELTHRVRQLARRETTLFMVLLAAFQVLLHRYSGQDDVAVGVPIAGRVRPELEGLIGFFVNTLVLRGNLAGDPSFADCLGRARAQALQAYEHQRVPFERLVEVLHPRRDLSRNPLFQASLAMQNTPPATLALGEIAGQRIDGIQTGAAKFDLTLSLAEVDGGLAGTLEYATDLFDAATIERMIGHFRTLLEGVTTDPQRPISRLPLLGPAERRQLVVEWNDTASEYPCTAVHELFERQAARTPDAVAVVSGAQPLSYRALDARANQLAHWLRAQGVKPGVLVALAMERAPELAVAMLGILKAGGAYLPLDPSHPRARLAFMLSEARPPVVLTLAAWAERLPPHAARVLCVDGDWAEIATHSAAGLGSTAVAEDLAYVVYTSGSTGVPKGVEVPHRAVANLLASMRREPGLAASDRWLAVTTPAFDIAALEWLLPLTVGAQVIAASRDEAVDGAALGRLIESSRATVMQATPATWQLLIDAGWRGAPSLTALVGGQALPAQLAAALLARVARLWNMYGPTETTVWSTCSRIERATEPITLGRPIANTTVRILDRHGELCPVGIPGEIHIGGAGVASGYLRRPDLTAERFVADPYAGDPGARMYRTGDRGRYRPDGTIEFLGRLDQQVKIRGFRVEPGEIEAALARHPRVREALVALREDTPGDPRLTAYVVARDAAIPATELRESLRKLLPEYMVPSAYVPLAALPRTPNGKIDRARLPATDGASLPLDASRHRPPRDAIEVRIAALIAELLGVARVGADDDFFDLGGNSLAAMRLLARLETELGASLDARAFFADPTVAALAARVSAAGAGAQPRTAPELRARHRDEVAAPK